MKSVSQLVNENNLTIRRNLRTNIEKQSLVINEQFIESFHDVNECLEDLYKNVNYMNDCCHQMIKQIEVSFVLIFKIYLFNK